MTTLDVRTPAEYAQGHVPGSVNLPLFTNEERHEVGKCYKQQGRDAAVKLGLSMVGPRLTDIIEQAEKLAPERSVHMYCWRGGMRSASVAWLLRTAGFEVHVIPGGYKAWRKKAMALIEGPLPLINIGGLTGTGKTEVLTALAQSGEQVVDLEALAHHRGSSFGLMEPQPSTEHFENKLGDQLMHHNLSAPIWIEDESRNIGHVYLNYKLFTSIRSAPFVFLEKSRDERIASLCDIYGQTDMTLLREAFERIRKRMGGQFVNAALTHLDQNDLASACALALDYYDKAYTHSLKLRKPDIAFQLDISALSPAEAAQQLIAWKHQNLPNLATVRAAAAK